MCACIYIYIYVYKFLFHIFDKSNSTSILLPRGEMILMEPFRPAWFYLLPRTFPWWDFAWWKATDLKSCALKECFRAFFPSYRELTLSFFYVGGKSSLRQHFLFYFERKHVKPIPFHQSCVTCESDFSFKFSLLRVVLLFRLPPAPVSPARPLCPSEIKAELFVKLNRITRGDCPIPDCHGKLKLSNNWDAENACGYHGDSRKCPHADAPKMLSHATNSKWNFSAFPVGEVRHCRFGFFFR